MSLLLAIPNRYNMSSSLHHNNYNDLIKPSEKRTGLNLGIETHSILLRDDDSLLRSKIKQVMELTNKSSDEVAFALHDADHDVNRAVNYLLEASTNQIHNEWKTNTSKKKKATENVIDKKIKQKEKFKSKNKDGSNGSQSSVYEGEPSKQNTRDNSPNVVSKSTSLEKIDDTEPHNNLKGKFKPSQNNMSQKHKLTKFDKFNHFKHMANNSKEELNNKEASQANVKDQAVPLSFDSNKPRGFMRPFHKRPVISEQHERSDYKNKVKPFYRSSINKSDIQNSDRKFVTPKNFMTHKRPFQHNSRNKDQSKDTSENLNQHKKKCEENLFWANDNYGEWKQPEVIAKTIEAPAISNKSIDIMQLLESALAINSDKSSKGAIPPPNISFQHAAFNNLDTIDIITDKSGQDNYISLKQASDTIKNAIGIGRNDSIKYDDDEVVNNDRDKTFFAKSAFTIASNNHSTKVTTFKHETLITHNKADNNNLSQTTIPVIMPNDYLPSIPVNFEFGTDFEFGNTDVTQVPSSFEDDTSFEETDRSLDKVVGAHTLKNRHFTRQHAASSRVSPSKPLHLNHTNNITNISSSRGERNQSSDHTNTPSHDERRKGKAPISDSWDNEFGTARYNQLQQQNQNKPFGNDAFAPPNIGSNNPSYQPPSQTNLNDILMRRRDVPTAGVRNVTGPIPNNSITVKNNRSTVLEVYSQPSSISDAAMPSETKNTGWNDQSQKLHTTTNTNKLHSLFEQSSALNDTLAREGSSYYGAINNVPPKNSGTAELNANRNVPNRNLPVAADSMINNNGNYNLGVKMSENMGKTSVSGNHSLVSQPSGPKESIDLQLSKNLFSHNGADISSLLGSNLISGQNQGTQTNHLHPNTNTVNVRQQQATNNSNTAANGSISSLLANNTNNNKTQQSSYSPAFAPLLSPQYALGQALGIPYLTPPIYTYEDLQLLQRFPLGFYDFSSTLGLLQQQQQQNGPSSSAAPTNLVSPNTQPAGILGGTGQTSSNAAAPYAQASAPSAARSSAGHQQSQSHQQQQMNAASAVMNNLLLQQQQQQNAGGLLTNAQGATGLDAAHQNFLLMNQLIPGMMNSLFIGPPPIPPSNSTGVLPPLPPPAGPLFGALGGSLAGDNPLLASFMSGTQQKLLGAISSDPSATGVTGSALAYKNTSQLTDFETMNNPLQLDNGNGGTNSKRAHQSQLYNNANIGLLYPGGVIPSALGNYSHLSSMLPASQKSGNKTEEENMKNYEASSDYRHSAQLANNLNPFDILAAIQNQSQQHQYQQHTGTGSNVALSTSGSNIVQHAKDNAGGNNNRQSHQGTASGPVRYPNFGSAGVGNNGPAGRSGTVAFGGQAGPYGSGNAGGRPNNNNNSGGTVTRSNISNNGNNTSNVTGNYHNKSNHHASANSYWD